MPTQSGFDYFEVQFSADGAVFDPAEVDAVVHGVQQNGTTDLVVISHGWNNDIPTARQLYTLLLNSLRSIVDRGQPDVRARRLAILAVLWPSRRFNEDMSNIASGAAGLGDGGLPDAVVLAALDNLAAATADPAAVARLQAARPLVSRLQDDAGARAAFADVVREVLPRAAANDEDASDRLFSLSGQQIMDRLQKPSPLLRPPAGRADAGGAVEVGSPGAPPPRLLGGSAGIGDLFKDARAGALQLLNYSTYYVMKARAGVVGPSLAGVLQKLRSQRANVRVHLVGHSFGARLVTAAAATAGPAGMAIDSMSLLQAAFSHYGFAVDYDGTHDGFFRGVISGAAIAGPILVTHTPNDTAVGNLYPLASLLAGDQAADLGDANSPYGGLGRNGAQKTPEAVQLRLLPVGSPYALTAGRIHNLEATQFVHNHSDITGPEVAQALAYAIAAT
jgi:hypothetical protein